MAKKTLAVVAALLVIGASVEAAKLTLVKDGVSEYRIVLPKGASLSEHTAAVELEQHIRQISGAMLPIVSEKSGPSILIGAGAAPASVDLTGLGDEGFVTKTVGKDIVIAGGRLRGTLYGVYDFLEDVLGCRWYSSEVVKIPQMRTIVVPNLDIREKPAFGFRDIYYTDAWHKEFAARNRLNGHHCHLDAAHGGNVYYSHFVHTFRELVPVRQYAESHPEYYSLVSGKRLLGEYDTQLCLTNPDVLKIATESVMRWIERNPNAKVVSVSANDYDNHCECDNCEAAAKELGGQAGLLLRFVNAIADEVGKKYPDVMIDTLAYWYTEWPPKNIRASKNVIVRYCPIWACQTHAYADPNCPENKQYINNFNGWKAKTDNLWIWHYSTNFVHYLAPFPNFYELSANAKMYRDNGVGGIFWQANGEPGGNGELCELRAWVISKIAWNPDADVHALAHDFINGYYGKAAPYIREYYDLLHREVKEKNIHITSRSPVTVALFSPEILSKCDRLFDKAEKVAESPEILKRVRRDRMGIEYVEVLQPIDKKEYQGREKELLAKLEVLYAKCKEFNISRAGGWGDIESFYKGIKKKLSPS